MSYRQVRFPSPPWRLEGTALLRLSWLPVDLARQLVPAPLKVVTLMPGKTLAVLYAARYGAGSSLEYHELIVAPALVRHGVRMGAWISNIYVDNEESLAGGRKIWALPKQLAQFNWDENDDYVEVGVSREGVPLCTMSVQRSSRSLNVPVFAPVISLRGTTPAVFSGRGRAGIARGEGAVSLHGHGALAELDFSQGLQLVLEDLQLLMRSPRNA